MSLVRLIREPERWVPKPDPPMRRGKRCAVCGHKLAPNVLEHKDPFCSTDCAKRYHGVAQTKGTG